MKSIWSMLAGGEVEALRDDFSAELRSALGLDQLKLIAPQLEVQLGALQTASEVINGTRSGVEVEIQRLDFERGSLELVVAKNAKGEISGIHFVPPPS